MKLGWSAKKEISGYLGLCVELLYQNTHLEISKYATVR